MRLRAADGTALHLAYCTNVHPADEAEGVIAQIDTFARPVREALGADRLGLGLWLSAAAARTLRHHTGTRLRLKAALRDAGCEVVTVNAFPYGAFQAPVVKQAVYHPDWTTPERLGYTVDAAWVLADLLPDDVARGSISTLPLAWRTPWDQTRAAAGRAHLQQLAEELGRIEDESGRTIRVGLEPEPGCLVETVEEAATALAGLGTDRIGVCLDLCHLATGFTTAQDALTVLREAGLPVVKAQVSAALHAQDPAASQGALRSFSEDRFLHQVRRRTAPGWTTSPRPWRRWHRRRAPRPRGRPRTRRPGGCTSTSRCTPSRPIRACAAPRTSCAPPWPHSSARWPTPITWRWRATPGRCSPRPSGPPPTPSSPVASPRNWTGPWTPWPRSGPIAPRQ